MTDQNLTKKGIKAVEIINDYYAKLHQLKLKRLALAEKLNQQ